MSTAIKFTKELRDKWAAALRSGKYRKTTGALMRMKNKRCSYCAIGLLGHVAGLKSSPIHPGMSVRCFRTADKQYIDMYWDVGVRGIGRVVTMNDHEDRSFKEIAAFVDTLPVVK